MKQYIFCPAKKTALWPRNRFFCSYLSNCDCKVNQKITYEPKDYGSNSQWNVRRLRELQEGPNINPSLSNKALSHPGSGAEMHWANSTGGMPSGSPRQPLNCFPTQDRLPVPSVSCNFITLSYSVQLADLGSSGRQRNWKRAQKTLLIHWHCIAELEFGHLLGCCHRGTNSAFTTVKHPLQLRMDGVPNPRISNKVTFRCTDGLFFINWVTWLEKDGHKRHKVVDTM